MDELKQMLCEHGAVLVGCADLQALPPDDRQNMPYGVSIAVGITDTFCGICIAVCPWTRKYIEKHKG